MFSRAAFLWTRELLADFDVPEEVRKDLRKIEAATAFAADATADAVQLSARSMAASVTVRQNTWLRHWDVDAASQSRVIGLPFKGEKLFGEALVPLLVESKGKKGVLPSREKSSRTQSRSSPQFFRGRRSSFGGAQPSGGTTSSAAYSRSSRRPWQRKSSFRPRGQSAQQPNPKGPKNPSA
ncbi:hypothetical protein lerEdw1_009057 [Lerista edwardsae]|nr:hypothetical protein lerEdw1_009057 [Lerista edwardsae]